MLRKLKLGCAILAAAFLTNSAFAATESTGGGDHNLDHGFYGYAAAGSSIAHNNADWNSDQRTPWQLGIGYEFNKYFGVEVGYGSEGTVRMANPSTGGDAIQTENGNAYIYNLVGKLPLNDTYALFATVGQQRWSGTDTNTGGGLATTSQNYSFSLNVVGIGAEMKVDNRTSIFAEGFRTSNQVTNPATPTYYTGITGGVKISF